jgi:hypothetical protein
MFSKRGDRDAVADRPEAVGETSVLDRTEVIEERREERWGGPPVVRGILTLLGVAGAGFLIWLATRFDLDSTGEFWAAMGILAAAGAVLGFSQLLGGWTKWGVPTVSPSVFVLGFLPALVAVGGILLATRPTGEGTQDDVAGWMEDIGLGGVAEDLSLFQGVLAFALGLVFSFIFDTTGPRRMVERETVVPDEDVHDYDRTVGTPASERTVVREDETLPAGTTRPDVS